MRILIVEARYHAHVADRLIDAATTALDQGLADEGDVGGDAARAALALATLRERLAVL